MMHNSNPKFRRGRDPSRSPRQFRKHTICRRARSPLEKALRDRSAVRLALDLRIQFGPEKHDDH